MKPSFNRPIPRIPTADTKVGSPGIQRPTRPQLSARWILDEDGKLVCRWDLS
jgi:hypothetical protein